MKKLLTVFIPLFVFIAFAGNAHAISSLGGPCQLNADCAGNLVCPNSTCQSDPNLDVSASGSIGDACRNNNNCSGTYYCAPDDTCEIDPSLPGNSSGTGTVSPAPATGAGGINTTYLKGYAGSITTIINTILVPLLIAVAFIVFLYGVFKYFIWNADNDTEREKGREFIMYGVIGFVVILSLWGLVALVSTTLGLTSGGTAASQGLKPPTL